MGARQKEHCRGPALVPAHSPATYGRPREPRQVVDNRARHPAPTDRCPTIAQTARGCQRRHTTAPSTLRRRGPATLETRGDASLRCGASGSRRAHARIVAARSPTFASTCTRKRRRRQPPAASLWRRLRTRRSRPPRRKLCAGCRPVGWSVGRSAGRVVDRSVGRSVGLSGDRSGDVNHVDRGTHTTLLNKPSGKLSCLRPEWPNLGRLRARCPRGRAKKPKQSQSWSMLGQCWPKSVDGNRSPPGNGPTSIHVVYKSSQEQPVVDRAHRIRDCSRGRLMKDLVAIRLGSRRRAADTVNRDILTHERVPRNRRRGRHGNDRPRARASPVGERGAPYARVSDTSWATQPSRRRRVRDFTAPIPDDGRNRQTSV